MAKISITIPSPQVIVKFKGLIPGTNWTNDDKSELIQILQSFEQLSQELIDSEISSERLRKIAFGSNSDKVGDVPDKKISSSDANTTPDSSKESDKKIGTHNKEESSSSGVLSDTDNPDAEQQNKSDDKSSPAGKKPKEAKRQKKNPNAVTKSKGHGRRMLSNISSSEIIHHSETSHKIGEPCPFCKGNFSKGIARKTTVISARAIMKINVHIQESIECKSCGHSETSQLPEKVQKECLGRYHVSAIAVLAYFRYFCGFASHRLDTATKHLGFRVPESTQWQLFESAADLLMPIFKHMKYKTANSNLIWMDHTHNHILIEEKECREKRNEGDKNSRIGINTSCYLSKFKDGNKIAFYHTAAIDAGQYLKQIIAFREKDCGPLVVACDALASNLKYIHQDVVHALCNSHARRQIVDLGKHIPKNGHEILKLYKIIFKNDRYANTLDSKNRLEYHATHSLPLMLKIRNLAESELLSECRVLGEIWNAFAYQIRHFEKLSAFCRIENAPLHTNDVERALKKPILHRKNSLFFQTLTGAGVGDLMITLCMTAHLNGVSPVDYLTTLLCNADKIKSDPEKWMPWNYLCQT